MIKGELNKALTRRQLARYSVGAAAAVCGPWVRQKSAMASSGSLTLLVDPGFELNSSHQAFMDATGVDLRIRVATSGASRIQQLRQHRADVCFTGGHDAPTWKGRSALAPWRSQWVPNMARIHEPLFRTALDDWQFDSGGPHWLPTVWGAEAIGWRTDMMSLDSQPSYAHLWSLGTPNSTLIRPLTAMLAVAYMLEHQRVLPPASVLRSGNDATALHRVFAQSLSYMSQYKDRMKMTWYDASSQIQGLLEDGAAIGQIWDTPALALQNANEPVGFRAPVEGALCWTKGWSLSQSAQNVEAAHEFVNWLLAPQHAGPATRQHGFHSAVRTAERYAGEQYQTSFERIFPQDVLARLRPLPQQTAWFRQISREYANRFLRA